MEWTNIALSGGSAERIIRTTIQWFGEDIRRIKNTFVIIGWPGPWRSEIELNKQVNFNLPENLLKSDAKWQAINIGNNESYLKLIKAGILSKEFYKYYQSWCLLRTHNQRWINYFTDIVCLQSYLKSLRIPYLFFHTSSALLVSNEYFSFSKQIDIRFWMNSPFKEDDSFCKILEKNFKYAPKSITNHFGEDGHQAWAKILEKKVNI
ncbi:uncharacterized protein METZ01_LOCUS223862, partial [marine metagenome]